MFFAAGRQPGLNLPALFCLWLFVCIKKIIVNKTSSLFERVHGFVCLLIFQARVKPGPFFLRQIPLTA
jgi:hypothetical protein